MVIPRKNFEKISIGQILSIAMETTTPDPFDPERYQGNKEEFEEIQCRI